MAKAIITITEVCESCNLKKEMVLELVQDGFITAEQQEPEPIFSEATYNELQRVARLHHSLELDTEAIEVVLHMRRQIEEMQQEMDELRKQMQQHEQELNHRLHDIMHQAGMLEDL